MLERWKVAVIAAMLFVAAVALAGPGLANPDAPYWDEPWYVLDARAILAGAAFQTPEHPPLWKLFLAGAIAIAGDRAWAWRLPSLVAHGALVVCVALPFLLGRWRERFGVPRATSFLVALAPALFLLLDPLMFTNARLATLDAGLVFFYTGAALAGVLALTTPERRAPLLALSSALGGAALAIKWTALTLPAGLVVLAVGVAKDRKNLKVAPKDLALVFVPGLVVYVASYLSCGISIVELLEQQWGMISFHTVYYPGVWKFFGSRPWEWCLATGALPILRRLDGDELHLIVQLGAPVFWIPGLVATVAAGVVGLRRRDPFPLALAVFPLMQLVLWSLAARATFIYYMSGILPFYGMAIAWWAARLLDRTNPRAVRGLLAALLVASAAYFIELRPVLIGEPLRVADAEALLDGPLSPFLLNRRTGFERLMELIRSEPGR